MRGTGKAVLAATDTVSRRIVHIVASGLPSPALAL